MSLTVFDEVSVLKKCRTCGGTKTVQDATGSTSPCTKCDDRGKEIVPVPIREFVNFIGQEMANQIRLKTGLR